MGIFYCYYAFLAIECGVSISGVSEKEVGLDVHMEVGAEDIVYITTEGGRFND